MHAQSLRAQSNTVRYVLYNTQRGLYPALFASFLFNVIYLGLGVHAAGEENLDSHIKTS